MCVDRSSGRLLVTAYVGLIACDRDVPVCSCCHSPTRNAIYSAGVRKAFGSRDPPIILNIIGSAVGAENKKYFVKKKSSSSYGTQLCFNVIPLSATRQHTFLHCINFNQYAYRKRQ